MQNRNRAKKRRYVKCPSGIVSTTFAYLSQLCPCARIVSTAVQTFHRHLHHSSMSLSSTFFGVPLSWKPLALRLPFLPPDLATGIGAMPWTSTPMTQSWSFCRSPGHGRVGEPRFPRWTWCQRSVGKHQWHQDNRSNRSNRSNPGRSRSR